MEGKEFKALVTGIGEFSINENDIANLDLSTLGGGQFHVLDNHESVHIEVVEADYDRKLFTLRLEGKKYQVQLADQFDSLVEQMGLSATGNNKVADIMAPMPGLVLDVLVEAGQEVKEGDPLIILEAMKMENVIKATGEATVVRVVVDKGKPVDKGQLLIELD